MRVEIKIQENVSEPYVVIHTERVTDEIQKLLKYIENSNDVLVVETDDKKLVLNVNDIYMIRVESEKTVVYGKDKKYITKKRLCELEKMLKYDFMKISKTTLINLKYINRIEPAFNGMMLLFMKNGCKDYISRKYLPDLKKYLGL